MLRKLKPINPPRLKGLMKSSKAQSAKKKPCLGFRMRRRPPETRVRVHTHEGICSSLVFDGKHSCSQVSAEKKNGCIILPVCVILRKRQ